jgi:CRISPR/Cas system CSM-associated protein Csm2 small subunit
MTVRIVHQKIKDESVEEAETAVRELFAAIDRLRPEGLRYASTRVVDSSTFVIVTELADGIAESSDDPRRAIPEFQRFLEQLAGWVDGPRVIEDVDVIGSYNLFGTRREASAVRG